MGAAPLSTLVLFIGCGQGFALLPTWPQEASEAGASASQRGAHQGLMLAAPLHLPSSPHCCLSRLLLGKMQFE
jgi:hypothetical protein